MVINITQSRTKLWKPHKTIPAAIDFHDFDPFLLQCFLKFTLEIALLPSNPRKSIYELLFCEEIIELNVRDCM